MYSTQRSSSILQGAKPITRPPQDGYMHTILFRQNHSKAYFVRPSVHCGRFTRARFCFWINFRLFIILVRMLSAAYRSLEHFLSRCIGMTTQHSRNKLQHGEVSCKNLPMTSYHRKITFLGANRSYRFRFPSVDLRPLWQLARVAFIAPRSTCFCSRFRGYGHLEASLKV